MATLARAVVTYVTTLTLYFGAVFVLISFSSPADSAVHLSTGIIFFAVATGLWAAIPTAVIGAIFWAMSSIGGMPLRWRAVSVSALTAPTSMKVSTYYYAEVFQEIGARDEVSLTGTIFLAILAGLVAFAIWTAFQQEGV